MRGVRSLVFSLSPINICHVSWLLRCARSLESVCSNVYDAEKLQDLLSFSYVAKPEAHYSQGNSIPWHQSQLTITTHRACCRQHYQRCSRIRASADSSLLPVEVRWPSSRAHLLYRSLHASGETTYRLERLDTPRSVLPQEHRRRFSLATRPSTTSALGNATCLLQRECCIKEEDSIIKSHRASQSLCEKVRRLQKQVNV